MNAKIINFFNRRIEKFKSHYDPGKLFVKLEKMAKTLGAKTVYAILILYYSLMGNNVSMKEKAMIIAALGYFILPSDLIPDIMAVIGFSDDFAVIWYIFKRIRKNVTSEVKQKARDRIAQWFPTEKNSYRKAIKKPPQT